MRLMLVILCLAGAVTAPLVRAAEGTNAPASEPALPLPPEAGRLTEVYRTELTRIAAQHADGLKALPPAYQAQLVALQKKLQASGDLDGYLAVTKEIRRFSAAVSGEADPFEKIPEMPESALVTAPDTLRALQDHYLKSYKERIDSRHKLIEELTNAYISQFDALLKDLTIRDRISDAITVKHEIDRLRKSLTDDTFVQQALVLAASRPAAAPASAAPRADATSATPATFGHMPDWARWEFEHDGNFAWEGYLFRHPDLPDELSLDFDSRIGRGRVYGRCQVDSQMVDMRERSWFGKALSWKVQDPATLNATITLQNREISPGQGSGPAAHLVLLGDKGPLGEGLDVTLMWHQVTLTLARDPATGKVSLGWTEGKIRKSIDLPASGPLRVLLGVTVRNPGERCDTAIEMH